MEYKQRVEYIIELYRKVNKIPSDVEVDELTKINNAEIRKICVFEGPAYFRVRSNLESRLGKIVAEEKKGELNTKEDVDKFHKVLKDCYELMGGRMQRYGNSWRIMDIQSIARLVMMKMDRIAELGEDNAKTKDELIDTINYCAFALIKFNEKENG